MIKPLDLLDMVSFYFSAVFNMVLSDIAQCVNGLIISGDRADTIQQ